MLHRNLTFKTHTRLQYKSTDMLSTSKNGGIIVRHVLPTRGTKLHLSTCNNQPKLEALQCFTEPLHRSEPLRRMHAELFPHQTLTKPKNLTKPTDLVMSTLVRIYHVAFASIMLVNIILSMNNVNVNQITIGDHQKTNVEVDISDTSKFANNSDYSAEVHWTFDRDSKGRRNDLLPLLRAGLALEI